MTKLAGNTTDSTKPAVCFTPHLTVFTSVSSGNVLFITRMI